MVQANPAQPYIDPTVCEYCGEDCADCLCLPLVDRPVASPNLLQRLREDINTVFHKDPAARSTIEVLTCYPGLHALWTHRIAHWFWNQKWHFLARLISHFNRKITGIEIHPGATIGRRVFIDHGMGVVIGETTEVGDDVLIYKGVVLGGTSLDKTKRHPTIGSGTVIGSNAVVLGPILVGHSAKIGSGSIVVKPVPDHATVVGVPGKVIKIGNRSCKIKPDLHHENLPDVVSERLVHLQKRITNLEHKLMAIQSDQVAETKEV